MPVFSDESRRSGVAIGAAGELNVMKQDRMRIRVVALLAAVGLRMAPGMAGAQAPAASQRRRPQTPPADAALAVSSAIEATASTAGAAVVEIFTMSYAPTEGRVAGTTDLVRTQRASGSGAIVDPDGYIVTNAHVVRGAQRIRVEVPQPADRRVDPVGARPTVMDGRIVGIDLETDLAVVKVEATGLPALTFGDSDELRAGQIVLALGSPLGFYNSVSLGVVSAVARQLEPESPMVYVQSDARSAPAAAAARSSICAAASSASTRWSRRAKAPPARASASPRRATSSAASTSKSARTAASDAATSACGRRR